MKKHCVYIIRNSGNGRFYIGSTHNFAQRKRRHFYDLKKGKHASRFMQRDYAKCGEDAFAIEILESVETIGLLLEREQFWLDALRPQYNSALVAGSCLGVKHTDEVVQKNRERNSGFGNGNARITKEQVEEALNLANKMTVEQIANKYGVSRTTIQRNFRRAGLKNVERLYGAESRKLFSQNAISNIAGRNAYSVFVLRSGEENATATKSVTEAARIIGIDVSAVAKRLKKSLISFYSDYCFSKMPIDSAMVAWPYRTAVRSA